MLQFLLGLVAGLIGKLVYDRYRTQDHPEPGPDLQRRATTILDESRQILQEIRQEVGAAAQVARERAEAKMERLREAAQSPAKPATPADTTGVGVGTNGGSPRPAEPPTP